MDIKIVEHYAEFLNLQPAWESLLRQSAYDHSCLTFEWFKAWWLGFGRDRKLLIMVVTDNGKPVALAPFMLRSAQYRGMPVRELSFIENDDSPCADFIVASRRDEVFSCIMRYLQEHRDWWDIVRLGNIPKHSPSYDILPGLLRDCGMCFGVKDGLRSPVIAVKGGWEDFLATRSKKFRKVLRNKLNRMERTGEYRIRCYDTITADETPLGHISAISLSSWKGRSGRAIMGNQSHSRFFRELSYLSSMRRWLNIWVLELNGRQIAYEYHLRYHNRLYALRADYDQRYHELSPGSVLDHYIVKRAFDDGVAEYDLCGSNDAYKLNWTSDIREHANIIAYRDSIYGKLLYSLEFRAISNIRKYSIVRSIKNLVSGEVRR